MASLKKLFSKKRSKRQEHAIHLRDSTDFADVGAPGPLLTDIFAKLKDIPGWFNVDDCGHFHLVLSYQSAMGVRGDMLEIGSFHGRSTALMASCLQAEEKIVVCDAFELEAEEMYRNKPSPERLIANVTRVNPGLSADRIEIHECLSQDLKLAETEMFRFIHVDGGHSEELAYSDLKLCARHLAPGGVLVMDDYHNDTWPEVTQGTDRFLAEHQEFRIMADLNRHGARGRKLYLVKG